MPSSSEPTQDQRAAHTLLLQRAGALGFGADGTAFGAEATVRCPVAAGSRVAQAQSNAKAGAAAGSDLPPVGSCQQALTLNFFFDGTGNNLDADKPSMQMSNVAKLYLAAELDDPTRGLSSFYIPGIGTYFKDIGDPGDTMRGKGMGAMGDERIAWARKRLDEEIKKAEQRAQNPRNKIIGIVLNVFGFSRGSTLARAFLRDVRKDCSPIGAGSEVGYGAGRHPMRVGFLGLFDTVASVGLPMSANNTPGAASAGLYALPTTLSVRANGPSGPARLALGEPGADPAPGDFDGHASWADGLAIPDFVQSCVHMVAGHELRNSFPVDSVLNGRRYPAGAQEMVYPGAHSDVGGGYQPGEGARSERPSQMLSLIPLRAMHTRAREAGVSLRSLAALQGADPTRQRAFALDADGAKDYAELAGLFNHYLSHVGGGRPLGQDMLAHSRCNFAWRFKVIAQNMAAQAKGLPGADAAVIAKRQPGFAAQRAAHQRTVGGLKAQYESQQHIADQADAKLRGERILQARTGMPVDPQTKAAAEASGAQARAAQDAYLGAKAQLDTLADDGKLIANLAAYDAQLLADAKAAIKARNDNPKLKLRPHYRNLVETYEAEFVHGRGLRDEKLCAFFERYVHDSLAGFGIDATLPSDPRVVYVGGDNKLRFAGVLNGIDSDTRAA